MAGIADEMENKRNRQTLQQFWCEILRKEHARKTEEMTDNVKVDFQEVWLWMRLTESFPLADFDINVFETSDFSDNQIVSNCCVLAVVQTTAGAYTLQSLFCLSLNTSSKRCCSILTVFYIER